MPFSWYIPNIQTFHFAEETWYHQDWFVWNSPAGFERMTESLKSIFLSISNITRYFFLYSSSMTQLHHETFHSHFQIIFDFIFFSPATLPSFIIKRTHRRASCLNISTKLHTKRCYKLYYSREMGIRQPLFTHRSGLLQQSKRRSKSSTRILRTLPEI